MKDANYLIEDIIENYEMLGFSFSKEDIINNNVSYDNVRVNYIDNEGRYIEKALSNIDTNDISKAYQYRKELIRDYKEYVDIMDVKNAFISLKYYLDDERNKDNTNKMIIDHLYEKYNNKKNNMKKEIMVINQETDKKVADKAKSNINKIAVAILAGTIIVSAAGASALYVINKYGNEKEIEQEDNTDNTINTFENNNTITITQEATETKTEENTTNNTDSEVEEEIDILSEDYINNVTDNIYSNIANTDLANEYSKDDIKKLVNYARGNEDLSHETVYEIFNIFIRHGVDISMFYEGLDCYEDLSNLDIAVKNIKAELDKYDDEYNAYKAIDNTLNNMNEDNYEEAVALRAYSDYYIAAQSMRLMLNVVEYDKDGKLINHGNLYNEQINGIDVNKIAECQSIYNNVNPANQDAKLTKIINNALNEVKSR